MATQATLTPALANRAREYEESARFLQTLLSGDMPAGFSPTIQDWGRILNLIEDAAGYYGWEAVTPAVQRWVAPAVTGNLPVNLRNQALELLANRAVNVNAYDPVLHQFLQGGGGGTVNDLAARANLLATLAPTMYSQPWFQEAYRSFVQQLSPAGNAAALPLPTMQALAQPYFTMQNVLGPQAYAATGLPTVQWPTSDVNMPRYAGEFVRNINELLAQLQGYQVGPQGLVRETPAEIRSRIVSGARDMLDYVLPPGGAAAGVEYGTLPGITPLNPLNPVAPVNPVAPTANVAAPATGASSTVGQRVAPQTGGIDIRQFLDSVDQGAQQAFQFLTGRVQPPPGVDVNALKSVYRTPADFVQALQAVAADPTLTAQERNALQQLLFWATALQRGNWNRWPS